MQIHTREHYELMEQFERTFKHLPTAQKEPKELWAKGHIYAHGATNEAFITYRHGYAFGRTISN
jgi:hypothetical protein